MKKLIFFTTAFFLFAIAAIAASQFDAGTHNSGTLHGYMCRGMVAVSSNATEAVTVKAVWHIGTKAVTNTLYSVTTANGYIESTTQKFVPPDSQIIVTGNARVWLFE